MGDFRVRRIKNNADRRQAYLAHLDDLKAFEIMLAGNYLEDGPVHIGAEQELAIVDKKYQPDALALELLSAINDEHYTNELALYNLEINLDPLPLNGPCFQRTEDTLIELIEKGRKEAANHQAHILMCGIIPTLKYHFLQFQYMTPEERYRTLSDILQSLRGSKFEIYLQGVDDLIMSLGSVLFEACNTSFQLHLQIPPKEFVKQHNWSQMIAGPVLSACVNSPLLFGRELWAETRIAIFKQSLDTRSSDKYIRNKLARVYFGMDWLQHSPAEIWQNNLSRFPLILTSDGFEKATEVLANGKVPNLRAIRLQNGTTYTWNRLCYGPTKPRPHLRIECRYLPAGPSAIDEVANFAFWTGLMQSQSDAKDNLSQAVEFKTAKDNFIKAARTGLGTTFNWFGRLQSAKSLLLDTLIPMAQQGLEQQGVASEDIDKYLSVFSKRVEKETTGADWLVRNYRSLAKAYGSSAAETELTRLSLGYQQANLPLHEWEDFKHHHPVSFSTEDTVEYLMSRDVLSINVDDCIEQAEQVMNWNNIHHLPVETEGGGLVGIITDGILERHRMQKKQHKFVDEIMLTDFTTVEVNAPISSLIAVMQQENLSGVPVVYQGKLIGMITNNDIEKLS